IESHASIFEQNQFVLPTPLRMDADERFTGRNVTIAFLDSGFYAHPDLTTPDNRILAYQSIFAEEGDQTSLETNDVASWHGMMTSGAAACIAPLTDRRSMVCKSRRSLRPASGLRRRFCPAPPPQKRRNCIRSWTSLRIRTCER